LAAWDFRPGTIGNTPYPDLLQINDKIGVDFGSRDDDNQATRAPTDDGDTLEDVR